jgi:hypothetical protein
MPCVLLSQWELEADYFAQDFMSGVIPVLFAEDPKEAQLAILADEYTAMKDLDRINRSFFIPETIDLEAAFKVVKNRGWGTPNTCSKRRTWTGCLSNLLRRKVVTFILS